MDLKDINLNGFTKNVIPMSPLSWNLNYQYGMNGLEHVFFLIIKWEQIPLNPTFCLTNYKVQSQTFDKLIVDLYKPPNHMVLIMHNIYVIF